MRSAAASFLWLERRSALRFAPTSSEPIAEVANFSVNLSPDRRISSTPSTCFYLSTPPRKKIPLSFLRKSAASPFRPTPIEGAYHDRLLRGVGCGGRGRRRRVKRSQGGFPVSGRRAHDERRRRG